MAAHFARIALLFATCADAAFIHPGVLIDAARLATLKSNIAGGIDPQFSFYNTATASVQGSLNYRPHGPPPGGVITCGPYSKPDIGCTNETDDGDAAFLHALFFALTSDERHAVLSRTILTLYSGPGGLTAYSDSNSPLQAAWSCGKFVRAAELLRWTPSSGWNDTDTDAFNTLMYGVHIPLIYEGSGSNGNWELSMIEGMMGIAAFSENATLLAHAADMWRQRTPAYFYNIVDGNHPNPLPRGGNSTTWYNQTVFNASTNGVCQETCRDFGHMQMGFGACVNAAETAYIQGVDLYSEQAERIATASEFASTYLMGTPPQAYLCSGAGIHLDTVGTFEIAYSHLHGQLGLPMPLTWQEITTNVRGPHCNQMGIVSVFESLTHGMTSPNTVMHR